MSGSLPSAAGQPPEDAAIAAAAAARPAVPPKEDSDTEPDEDAEPRGDGWIGHGAALQVGAADKARDFVDGGGLCSPGRWVPERRRLPAGCAVARLAGEILKEL